MPRFFFHIRDGETLIPDEEGSELPDLSAAHEEAVQSAREIIAEKVRAGELLDGETIEIVDAQGTILEVVPFRTSLKMD